MADKIKIPVTADVETSAADKKIAALNKQIEALIKVAESTGKVKIDSPFAMWEEDIKGMRDALAKAVNEVPALVAKMKQQGVNNILDFKFNSYVNQNSAAAVARKVLVEGLGATYSNTPRPPVPRTPPPAPLPPSAASAWRNAGMNVLNSGLNASGSWGGAVSQGLSGFGGGASMGAAGIGFVGALAGMAVSKLVGAVVDKIGQAQDNVIQMDKIMRSSGVNRYGSAAWQTAFYGGANASGMKMNDFTQFAGEYQRNANFRGGPMALATAAQHIAEYAHGFGMEPGAASGVFATASSNNLYRDQAGLQKMGLWIGEGIVKSGATAQSQKFMESVGNYMETQSRVSLGNTNVAGYIGALSGLAGSGLPGMSVANAAQLLNTVNSTMQKGGGMGQASQMMNARMAMNNGIRSPFQLQLLQEGGMFATADSTFGAGSMYARHFGTGPRGSKTMFQMTKEELGREYVPGSPEYYQALSNHLNISRSQAMALDELNDNDVTKTASALSGQGLKLEDMNASAIQDLVAVNAQGGAGGVARKMLSNPAGYNLSSEETGKLQAAVQKGDKEELKDVVNQLLAQHGQVETEGSKTRDALAKINNTFQQYAEKAIPALNTMMMAAVVTAGGKKALEDKYASALAKENDERIGTTYKSKRDQLLDRKKAILDSGKGMQDPAAYKELTDIENQLNTLNGEENVERFNSDLTVNREAYGNQMGYLPDTQLAKIRKEKLTKATLARWKGMEQDIQDASKKYGVDASLIRGVAFAESRFDQSAGSSAGAKGVMQLGPDTEKGFNHGNQRENIMGGAHYLSYLRNKYPNASLDEILRMYNGGPNYRKTRAYGSKENTEYPFRVQQGMDLTDAALSSGALSDVDVPNTNVGNNATLTVKADPMELHHTYSNGQAPRKDSVRLQTQFDQPYGWGSAVRH